MCALKINPAAFSYVVHTMREKRETRSQFGYVSFVAREQTIPYVKKLAENIGTVVGKHFKQKKLGEPPEIRGGVTRLDHPIESLRGKLAVHLFYVTKQQQKFASNLVGRLVRTGTYVQVHYNMPRSK